MSPVLARRLRLLASALSVLALLAALAVAWIYFQIRASLPPLDGALPLAGLSAPVTVQRDAQGVPTVRGSSRADVARALGFLHAQDRFFQMDLLRRRAAGELAELIGAAALPLDRRSRPHRFRALAGQVLAGLTPERRYLIDGYTAGVNAGLASLGKHPFEYLALRTAPAAWQSEDSVLAIYAMALDLQDSEGSYELTLSTLRDALGTVALDFFAPLVEPGSAALDDSTAATPEMPTERHIDLRHAAPLAAHRFTPADEEDRPVPGSNSFALTGAHTASGAPLLANDPHLDLGVPNIWYRARLEWTDGGAHQLTGVTLPGLPFMVIGSNGEIAWSFTNAYVDTGDLVVVPVNAVSQTLYKAPGHEDLLPIEKRRDEIRVKGGAPVVVETEWTIWGPVVGADQKERPLSYRWTMHDPAAVNFDFVDLEVARDATAAVAVAQRAGIAPQNLLVADTQGNVAWTILGRLPRRVGFDGRMPVSWFYGDRHWEGFLPPAQVPTLMANSRSPAAAARHNVGVIPGALAASGKLWTANNRLVGDGALALLGDGDYDQPARAAQIRDDLAKLENATAQDLLAVQLDDRAVFLARWQKLLVATLTDADVAQHPSRARLRELAATWEGRASVDSISYRLVRAFRAQVAQLALNAVFAPCVDQWSGFSWRRLPYESGLWTMIERQPAHLLDVRFQTWHQLLVAAADAVVSELDEQGVPLDRATWGARNTSRIQHPLGRVLPGWLAGWLNLPAQPLPGDANMPRVQAPAFGASMRMVVTPGRENEGLMHLPGGVSGHPLSPFYRAGHEAWARGEPAPFLPGPAVHTLTLRP